MSGLSKILGHKKNIGILKSQYLNKKIPHCYVFAGPGGVGKKSLAAEFARLLSCSEPGFDADACGVCKSCVCADKGSHPDIICLNLDYQLALNGGDESKGAKYSYSIDTIHELSRRLNLKAAEGCYRTLIIDDAEVLSEDAGGALLKILEEPPENTVFILVAENTRKILPTIISRAQVLRFGSLSLEDFRQAAERLELDVDENDFYIYNGAPGAMLAETQKESVFDFEALSGFEGTAVESGGAVRWLETYGSDRETAADLLEKLIQKIRAKPEPSAHDLVFFERVLRAKVLSSKFVNSQLVLTELYLKMKGCS